MMASPFPGMDPFLEGYWSDIHTRLITYICEALQPCLPDTLFAQAEESVLVDESSDGETRLKWVVPDVALVGRETALASVADVSSNSNEQAVAEPLIIEYAQETQRWVEILDLEAGGRVVTAIEVLSPSNKRMGVSREAYMSKQARYLASDVHLVEIDLLRGGERVGLSEDRLPSDRRAAYYACVHRAMVEPWRRQCELYPMALRAALPSIRVPLRSGDADVPLSLQSLVERCYVMGRYDRRIDYSVALKPPLDPEDADWMKGRLTAFGGVVRGQRSEVRGQRSEA